MMTHDDRGEGGVKNCQNGGDVICGCPLTYIENYIFREDHWKIHL